jgi:hypothetical protein
VGKKYIIQKSEDYDIRGSYRLSTLAGMPSLSTQKMILSGEKNAPKMQVIFTDTVKIDVKLERNGKDIAIFNDSFSFKREQKVFFHRHHRPSKPQLGKAQGSTQTALSSNGWFSAIAATRTRASEKWIVWPSHRSVK